MKRFAIAIGALALCASFANAQVINVAQGAQSFQVNPITVGVSLEDAYNYSSSKYHGVGYMPSFSGPAAEANTFFVHGTDGLGVFTVFNPPENATAAILKVVGESLYLAEHDGEGTDTVVHNGNTWDFTFNWLPGFTDGFALGLPENGSLEMSILGGPFTVWNIRSYDGGAWHTHELDNIYDSPVTFAATPEPATIGLGAVVAMGTLALFRRRRKN